MAKGIGTRIGQDGAEAGPRPLTDSPEILYSIFEFAPDAILLVHAGGHISKANAQAHSMFGYGPNELVGRSVEVLVPDRFSGHHARHRAGYAASPRTRPMGAGLDLFGRRKDGTEFPVDIMLSPLAIEEEGIVLAVVRDATERKRAEEAAEAARQMYLKEIHHRIKNNLQIISSLLFLQAMHTPDAKVVEILNESRNRVKSIALIHERLYRSPGMARVEMAAYIEELAAELFRTYGVFQERLGVHIHVDDISLGIDTAIPCGLILNELITNVLKHAFPDGGEGQVTIGLHRLESRAYALSVRDTGVGLPEGIDWQSGTTLGLRLVSDLVRQLDGTLDVTADGGTAFSIVFRELQYKERS